jgi:hypothetical protein
VRKYEKVPSEVSIVLEHAPLEGIHHEEIQKNPSIMGEKGRIE